MKTPTCQTVYFIALGVLSTLFLTLCPASGQDACKPAPPAGLKKGDLYYVAFITRNQRNATDKDINKYNQFVFDQAKNVCPTVLLPFSYRAIASTAAKSAKDNLKLKVTPPVYRVDGKRVVEHAEYLFGGLGLDNPVNIDERGALSNELTVWTGTNWEDGSTRVDGPLGGDLVGIADPQSSDAKNWVQTGRIMNDQLAPLYAISTLLRVP